MSILPPQIGSIYRNLSAVRKLAEVTKIHPEFKSVLAEKRAGIVNTIRDVAANPNLRKGLMFGVGAAPPLILAGNYVADRATENAKNKAIEVGLGAAALGGGLYALHKGLSGSTDAPQKLGELMYLHEVLDNLQTTDTEIIKQASLLKEETANQIVQLLYRVV